MEVGRAPIYMFCLAKAINSRFTDHLDQCIELTRFRPEVSTLPGKTKSIWTNQRRTQPSAATDHAVTPTVVVQFSTSLLIALTRSPTTVGSGIAHILAFVANGRESSLDCECAFKCSVNVLCETHIFPGVIPINARLLSRDMIKCDNSTRLWRGLAVCPAPRLRTVQRSTPSKRPSDSLFIVYCFRTFYWGLAMTLDEFLWRLWSMWLRCHWSESMVENEAIVEASRSRIHSGAFTSPTTLSSDKAQKPSQISSKCLFHTFPSINK